MCCETSNRLEASSNAAPSLPPAQAEFYASLHDGMHAMAQPITLLRSHFYLERAGGDCGLRSRQLVADAAASAEQLCTLFRLMQELVHVHGLAPHLVATPLSSVFASLAEDAEIVFAGTHIRLHLAIDPQSERVHVNLNRTRHALLSMLHVARASSEPCSVVICRVAVIPCWAEVILESEASLQFLPEHSLDEVARLHLALARANILGQGGLFRHNADPFALSMKLPLASGQV